MRTFSHTYLRLIRGTAFKQIITYSHYDPQVGRFIQKDPIGLNAGDTNLYRYVENNPLIYNDPLGLKLVMGSAQARTELSRSLADIWATKSGNLLLRYLMESPTVYVIDINYDGDHRRSGNWITVDPTNHPLIFTNKGLLPASTTRILAHELGHLTGVKDKGTFQQMENVRGWENPIMEELENLQRTRYETEGGGICGSF